MAFQGRKAGRTPLFPLYAGSPPHTRGKAREQMQRGRVTGITPAYAGKSTRSHPPPARPGDHPRIRGEKYAALMPANRQVGSPPHTRGKASASLRWANVIRITPAYAGKRVLITINSNMCRDHPRIRGEKSKSARTRCCTEGSPPHTRGKANRSVRSGATRGSPPHTRGKAPLYPVGGAVEGITPAYAGKSRSAGISSMFARDHPRIRGEKGLF